MLIIMYDTGQQVVINISGQMIVGIAARYDFADRWLAEAWVELNSQRINMTDGPCWNTMAIALSAKGMVDSSNNARLVLELSSGSDRGRPTRDTVKKY